MGDRLVCTTLDAQFDDLLFTRGQFLYYGRQIIEPRDASVLGFGFLLDPHFQSLSEIWKRRTMHVTTTPANSRF
ncbi:MAG TPA: hypothetical protein VKT78_11185 [Fimbriimonadaceae bacterium]|nr:hypothetical protein [Fimbriimonadaceae bacterium]